MEQTAHKMKWEKKGLIYKPSLNPEDWRYSSALTPTPILLNDDVIRVYFGARDKEGVSRIGYADLNSDNPSEILDVSAHPVLDIGQAGSFDDNGVFLGDVVKDGDRLRMYYVGMQKVARAKFLVFGGLAFSDDHGNTFQRFSNVPVMDRSDEGRYFRAIHTALYEDGVWKIWYNIGDKWTYIDDKPFPNYYMCYTESSDGLSFPKIATSSIQHEGDEYRLARPRVYKTSDGYEMYYSVGRISGSFTLGRAISKDGIHWTRQDSTIGIDASKTGWDSQALSYPSLLKVRNKTYLFYNGNNFGFDGFGYAELVED